jgi:DNA topoisomerase I
MPQTVRKRTVKVALLPADPYESAKIAGLRYVNDSMPGITRRAVGTGFAYYKPDGTRLVDGDEIGRIRSLVIPPAWKNVWICPSRNGHLQAVGFDQRGRKQYRYHAVYRQVRDTTKFTRMVAFGMALPKIRQQVSKDLQEKQLARNKVLAAIVWLLEATSIRIGNDEYRKLNESFGLTTLRNRHVAVDGSTLHFHFKGKSGQIHDIQLTDRKMARIVRECQEIPGHELFQYIDEEGNHAPVDSSDVNAYLQKITGDDFTAKDFRTWNGSREAALALEAIGPAESESAAKKNVIEAIKITSRRLGNRPATCRKYYIHPAVLDGYADGTLFEIMRSAKPQELPYGLVREEVAIMQMVATHIPKLGKAATKDEDLAETLKKSVAQIAAAEIQIVPSSSAVNLA